MARKTAAAAAIPSAQSSVPYPTWADATTTLFAKGAEAYACGATGAATALDVALPFDPAVVFVYNETTLATFMMLPSMAAGKALKEITAGTKSLLAANGITLGVGKVTLGTSVQTTSDVLHVLAIGFRENGGS